MVRHRNNQTLCVNGTWVPFDSILDSEYLNFSKDCVTETRETSPGINVLIPLYALIFFLAVVGNTLVIITFFKNRRMRTVTNVLLLNLAVADLLLGVFCMPFTLVGQILKNFIFGHIMCRIIPYVQAVSVSVGVWTLVAISLERYFAICRPLQSRKWQTRSHAYKMIFTIWLCALILLTPIALASELQSIKDTGRFKCRENFPTDELAKIFNVSLAFLLLLLPLCIMVFAYSLIVTKLWKGMKNEMENSERNCYNRGVTQGALPSENSMEMSAHSHHSVCKLGSTNGGPGSTPTLNACSSSNSREGGTNEILTLHGGKGVVVRWKRKDQTEANGNSQKSVVAVNSTKMPYYNHTYHQQQGVNTATSLQNYSQAIRSTYTSRSIESKKKVIRMLFVLVVEFFVCWTPLYVVNTWCAFDQDTIYNLIGIFGVALIQLLAYSSSCCNPITYSFMNRKFRQSFFKLFQCTKSKSKSGPPTYGRASEVSGNDSLIFGVHGSNHINKSEVLVLQNEDRV